MLFSSFSELKNDVFLGDIKNESNKNLHSQ